jgi:hypothetical protein
MKAGSLKNIRTQIQKALTSRKEVFRLTGKKPKLLYGACADHEMHFTIARWIAAMHGPGRKKECQINNDGP